MPPARVQQIGAVMSPAEAMVEGVQKSGAAVGEKWWELPLEDDYFELLKSKCADMNNIGGRWGGSITAGLFLKQFVDAEKMEWAHLDMAGPVWSDNHGPTGYGAATLAAWAEAQGKQ
jgi:leucyl aminopeptidase